MSVRKNKMFLTGAVLLCILMAVSWIVPQLLPWSSTEMHADIRNMGMSKEHFFGTDKFGRDLFVRVCYGTRLSLFIGGASALLNGIFGILYGGIAGYAGRSVDMILMRLADILVSIPSLLYVILIMLIFGADERSILLGLCVSGWIDTARLVRGEVMRLKEREFCIASRLFGAGSFQVFFRHILPNAAGPVIVNLTYLIPQSIFTETFLSFVGIGIPAPAASLGTLIQASRSQMQVYPYQMFLPVFVLCVLILALNMMGAGLEACIKNRRGSGSALS